MTPVPSVPSVTVSHRIPPPCPTLTICPAHDQYPASILLVNIVLSDSVLIHAHLIVNIRDKYFIYVYIDITVIFIFFWISVLVRDVVRSYLRFMCLWANEPCLYSTDDREINCSCKITEPRVCLLSWASGAPVADWRCSAQPVAE